jgi:DME family drug/metabolite transporter
MLRTSSGLVIVAIVPRRAVTQRARAPLAGRTRGRAGRQVVGASGGGDTGGTVTIPGPISLSSLPGSIPRTDYARGVVYATAAGIALGTLGPISNLAYAAGLSSPTFAALRATIGALTLTVFLTLTDADRVAIRHLSGRDRVLLGLTAAAQAALSLAIFAAYAAMAVAPVVAVYFCYPVIVAVASIALGRERLTAVRAGGLLLAIAGLSGVVLGGSGGSGQVTTAGIVLAGFAASCQAIYLVASRSGFTRVPSQQATGVILAGAAVLIWLVAIPSEVASGHPGSWLGSPTAWAAAVVAGVLGAAMAKVWMLRGVRRVGGTRAAVLMLAEPVTGVVLAAVLLSQGITPIQLAGGVAVLGGALLAQRPAPALPRATSVSR